MQPQYPKYNDIVDDLPAALCQKLFEFFVNIHVVCSYNLLQPDVRWSNYPLPPPPLPPFSSPPPPNLPTHDQICKTSSALRVSTDTCRPQPQQHRQPTTTPPSEPNTPCGDNTLTDCKPPTSEDCDYSDFGYRTAINSAPNQPVCEYYQDLCAPVCDSTSEGTQGMEKGISSIACEPAKITCPPKYKPQEAICGMMESNRTQSQKATRRPFTIPGLPKNYTHPKPKDYNFPPPFKSPEASVLTFLRLKADKDVDAYLEELCRLTTLKANFHPSGDCARPNSREGDGQITPPDDICSSKPTVEFIMKQTSGSIEIDLCELSVTPEKMSSDICKHITRTTTPSKEDLQRFMTKRKDINKRKNLRKCLYYTESTHTGTIHSKQALEEYCKKNTTSSTGDSYKSGPQPWITQYCKPKYQTNTSIAKICCNAKKGIDLSSRCPSKPNYSKSPCVPNSQNQNLQSKSQSEYEDCIKKQSLSRSVSEFSSQSQCPVNIKPVCPDPPKRYPKINSSNPRCSPPTISRLVSEFSSQSPCPVKIKPACHDPPKRYSKINSYNPRYSPHPICKEDLCTCVSRYKNDLHFNNRQLKCKPDVASPPPKKYSSPAINYGNTPNKPSKPCERSTGEIWRPPIKSDPQTYLNMKKQIDEAEKCKTRKPFDPCYPEERGHNRIPYNPCCPRYHKGNHKRFKMIFFFLGFPLIIFQVS